MGKKTVFTNITPLPPQVSREVAIAMLHNHDEMIELNPLVIEHHPIKTPRDAPSDEFLDCAWQEMTDRIHYLPGGIVKGKVSYKGCFHNLPNGLQTHIYAPMNLDIREKWTVCGSLPGEPDEPQELGLSTPRRGLYLREDGEMKCNLLMTSFVRKNLDSSHKVLVERILAKAERVQAHLDRSASGTPHGSTSTASPLPAFQPGSHMSGSSIVRQMTTNSWHSDGSNHPSPPRTSGESAAVRSVRAALRQEFVQELAGPSAEQLNKPLPRQPTEDEDDAELATIHPAMREQYRRSRAESLSRSDTVLPAYAALKHQKGQFFHEDLAKRPPGKQFAAELEGSPGIPVTDSPTLGRNQVQQHKAHEAVESGASSEMYLPRTVFGQTAITDDSASQDSLQSHMRTKSHPTNISVRAYAPVSASGNGTLDRFSVVSGMPTPRPGQHEDSRFSVVSAMTDMPTPQQSTFAQAQEQKHNFF